MVLWVATVPIKMAAVDYYDQLHKDGCLLVLPLIKPSSFAAESTECEFVFGQWPMILVKSWISFQTNAFRCSFAIVRASLLKLRFIREIKAQGRLVRLLLKHSQKLAPLVRGHFEFPIILHGNGSSFALRIADYIVGVDQMRAMDPEKPMLF